MNMTTNETRIAQDFEDGWDDERWNNAEHQYGPGILDFIPDNITRQIDNYAQEHNLTPMQVLTETARRFFNL